MGFTQDLIKITSLIFYIFFILFSLEVTEVIKLHWYTDQHDQ